MNLNGVSISEDEPVTEQEDSSCGNKKMIIGAGVVISVYLCLNGE